MKKILALLLLVPFTNVLFAQQYISGNWQGRLMGQLRVVFHFNKSKDGTIIGLFDSPDQHVNGLPTNSVTVNGDSVFVTLNAPKAQYIAIFTNDSTLSGFWIQGSANVPLQLVKTTIDVPIVVQNRPQTPKPPFPYISDSVEYDNTSKTVHLGATFTRPKENKKYPVALLITGSGQQDRDETILGHRSFAVIADYLTKNGFAVLRVDDRQTGKSIGDLTNATSLDFAQDAFTSINYLKTRPDVDTNKIGLIGHSEGGMIAPMVYSKWPHVAFIISLAGTGISGAQILLRQQTDPVKNSSLTTAQFNGYYQLTQKRLTMIHNNSNLTNTEISEKEKTVFEQWKSAQPDSILIALGQLKVLPAEKYVAMYADELKPWFKYFIATNPSQFWQQVKCPVLALNGSRDIQVYPEQNIPAINNALRKADNKNVTTKIFPGLNHLFQHCSACTTSEYGELEETFAPEVLETMATWLKKNLYN